LNDAIDPARLVADLYACQRRDVKTTIGVHRKAARSARIGVVRNMKPVILLLVLKRAVRLNLIAVDSVRS